MNYWKITLLFLFLGVLLFFVLFFIFVCFVAFYFRITSRFWFSQPVFHIYDIHYYFFNKGIINKQLPTLENSKFIDFKNVSVEIIDWGQYMKKEKIKDIPSIINEFVLLIQEHYFISKENKNNKFYPMKEHIIPYMTGHNAKCFLSCYKNELNEIIGVMTSRPIHIQITNVKSRKILNKFDAYYVDFLCVKKIHRKAGVAEKLIQTHEYFQRHTNKDIAVSVFKREEEITGIVPICIYKTFGFNMKNWRVSKNTQNQNNQNFLTINGEVYNTILTNKENINVLYSFLKEHQDALMCHFEVFIQTSFANLITLINSENIYIYYVLDNKLCESKKVSCVFFFRKTRTFINKNQEQQFLSFFASIKTPNLCNENFILLFKNCLSSLVFKTFTSSPQKEIVKFTHLLIEDISDNGIILKNILLKTPPILVSPTAFFFYNFAWNTFSSSSVFALY